VADPPNAGFRRPLQALATISVALLGTVYLLAVRTRWGQRLDATALHGRQALRPRAVHAAARLLTTIDVASVALLGGVIVLVALVRARPRLAVGAGFVILGAILTTELLKRVVLARPDLGVFDAAGGRPSFPSGHTTVAMSLAVAAILVAPSRVRGLVGIAGAAYASAIGVATVATATHRPSDPIGAVLVVTAWGAAVAAVLVDRTLDGRREHMGPRVSPWLAGGGLALLVVGFVGLVATVVAIRRGRLETIELGGAFLGAATAIAGTVLVATAALLAALRGIPLDRPGLFATEDRTSSDLAARA
jgi:membrane-associated phospholipid phosphatase